MVGRGRGGPCSMTQAPAQHRLPTLERKTELRNGGHWPEDRPEVSNRSSSSRFFLVCGSGHTSSWVALLGQKGQREQCQAPPQPLMNSGPGQQPNNTLAVPGPLGHPLYWCLQGAEGQDDGGREPAGGQSMLACCRVLRQDSCVETFAVAELGVGDGGHLSAKDTLGRCILGLLEDRLGASAGTAEHGRGG